MQNKGFVKFVAVALTLICLFYLSFSLVTSHYDSKIAKLAETDSIAARELEDSLNTENIYLWNYNLKRCREISIGLGLDLKGGMNAILEVSAPDVVDALADYSTDPAFRQAMDKAKAEKSDDFVGAFVKAFKEVSNDAKLTTVFNPEKLGDQVKPTSSNADVESALRRELSEAVDNTIRVLRTRIDRFGVVQPNIQKLEGSSGRIMVELPGIKEPERAKKLLEGSANLQFWETYHGQHVAPLFQRIDNVLAGNADTEAEEAEEIAGAPAAEEVKAAGETEEAKADESVRQAQDKAAEEAKAEPAKEDVAKADSTKDKATEAEAAADAILKQAADKKDTAAEKKADAKESPLLSKFHLYPSGAMIGFAHERDTAAVMQMLRSDVATEILDAETPDIWLLWGVKGMAKKQMQDIVVGQMNETQLKQLQGIKDESDRAAFINKFSRELYGTIVKDDALFELYAINTAHGQNGHAQLEGDKVTESKADFNQLGQPVVTMAMNYDGARIWAEMTERAFQDVISVGNRQEHGCVAVVLDGYVYSAPGVSNGKIDGGRTEISGNFTTNDTKELANVLSSGRMPAPANIIQYETVGPTLGQQSINAGIISFIIAFIILMIYMCMMYGLKAGMVANSALILNFFFTLGILTSFQAALTMAGIAGMVLTLGTAVDANVLIYERTKEEMRAGKGLKSAVAAGYSNAFSAIFDSNLTSIITGVILFYFGTGPIRGFATTLIIGIVCSFFTAVWLTRIVYENRLNRDKWQDLTFTTRFSKNLMQGTKYNFMGIYKKSFLFFLVFIIVCAVSLTVRGLSESIDFTGGRNYQVEFVQQVEPEQARAALRNTFDELNKANKSEEPVTTSVIAIGTEGKQLRVSTNYKINVEDDKTVDAEIEETLYNKFCELGMLDKSKVSLDKFVDRNNRDAGSIISSQKVGPSIAKDITRGAIISVILALVAIFLYILLRFRNVAYSVGSIVALTVDTFLIIGMYSLCYGWIGFSLDIDQTFIGAILTAIGYSINDKVVIFDRIRENFRLYPKRDRQRLFNESLNSTLARTINTSVSTLIVLLAIFIFGGDSIRSFSFAMILGVIFGTCSSIFIAAPTAFLVMGRRIKAVDEEEATVVEEKK